MAARDSVASSALFWSWSSYCGFSAASELFLGLVEFGVPPRFYVCSSWFLRTRDAKSYSLDAASCCTSHARSGRSGNWLSANL
jgi:hypothetical protein